MRNLAVLVVYWSLLIAGCLPANAQSAVDVRQRLLVIYKANPDTASVNAALAVARHYFNKGFYDSSLQYARESTRLSALVKDQRGYAKSVYAVGLALTNLTNYDSASYYMSLAEQQGKELKDSFLIASCYNTMAMLYRYQSDYPTSLAYAIKSAGIAERSTDSTLNKLIPKIYFNISSALIQEKQYDKAIAYDKRSLQFSNYSDEQRYRILFHLDLSDAFTKTKKFPAAKLHLDTALLLDSRFDNPVISMLAASSAGFYYDNTGDYTAAVEAYLKAHALSQQNNNDYLEAEAADNLATIYFKLKNYEQSATFAKEANAIAIRLKHFNVAANTFNILKEIAAIRGDYELAYTYAEQTKTYSDSASNEATRKATISLETRYQLEKKQKEISDLTIANTRQELAVIKRNRFLLIGGITSVALLLLIGLLYKNSRHKQTLAENEQQLQKEQIKMLEQQQRVISLQSMIKGQDTERSRIAKDLHDDLGGLFSTIKMYLSTLKHQQAHLNEDELFNKAVEMTDTAATEVRRVAHSMMPEALQKMGLMNALKDLCDTISAGRQLKVSLELNGMETRLPQEMEVGIYRIIKELLNNTIKHAAANTAIVQLIRDGDYLNITVEDDGKGFDTNNPPEGTGIDTVKSRTASLGGHFQIESQKDIGTTIMMDFNISNTEHG